MAQLEEKGRLPGDVLVKRKLGLLHALGLAGVPADQVLLHFLAAAADANDQVARWVASG